MTKLTVKPIEHGDKVNKSRDASGLRKWSRESRSMGIAMRILGWFTIPAEVLLRRRFGQRWFTPMNFFIGAFLISTFVALQYISDKIESFAAHFERTWNPFYSETAPYGDPLFATKDMLFLLVVYVVLGIIKLFASWWRNRMNKPVHSYDDGESYFLYPGKIIVWLLNMVATPFMFSLAALYQQKDNKEIVAPKLIEDPAVFANIVMEPLFFFWFATELDLKLEKLFMFITAFAVAIYASGKNTARKSKLYDLHDAAIEAKAMRELRMGNQAETKKQAAKKQVRLNPRSAETFAVYPSLQMIIDELHLERNQSGGVMP